MLLTSTGGVESELTSCSRGSEPDQAKERKRERERERECVCVREREIERQREGESVCVCEREKQRERERDHITLVFLLSVYLTNDNLLLTKMRTMTLTAQLRRMHLRCY